MINIKPGTIMFLHEDKSIFDLQLVDKGENSKKVIFLSEELTFPHYSVIKILIDGKVKNTYYSSLVDKLLEL